jgi:arsenate reductase
MAEAVLNKKGAGRFQAESAGSSPAARVNPYAIQALRESGIEWDGRPPRGIAGLEREHWDFLITVCDRAKEACPVFPGQPVLAHWGMADPAAVEGDEAAKRAAFARTLADINLRMDELLSLPLEDLQRSIAQARLQAIGAVGTARARLD